MPASTPRTRKRILFLSMYHLGWKTLATQLEEHAKSRTDLDISCVRVVAPLWLRLLLWRWPKPFSRSLIKLGLGWRWYIARKYRALVLTGEYDLLYANSQVLALGLLDLCRKVHVKLAVALDVTGPAHARDLLKQAPDRKRNWSEEASIYEAARLIVPMSRWTADSLVNDMGVAREKIMVMPPSVDLWKFRAENQSPTPPDHLPRILFCGDDWKRKGGARLLGWHQKYWADLAELHLVSGKAVVPPGLKNVVVHGNVPYGRWLHEILPSSQIFCLPTREDMSPYALAEAQAAGLPTVSSRVGGIPELIVDGETGFVLAADDDAGFVMAVTRLLREPALRLSMGQAARAHATAKFDAAVLFERLFDRLAGEIEKGTVEAGQRNRQMTKSFINREREPL